MLAPVAIPSSTTMTTRPSIATGGASPKLRRRLRSISASSRFAAASIYLGGGPISWITSSFRASCGCAPSTTAEGKLLMPRRADLAHQKKVEFRVER
jgi:hypothetical protein